MRSPGLVASHASTGLVADRYAYLPTAAVGAPVVAMTLSALLRLGGGTPGGGGKQAKRGPDLDPLGAVVKDVLFAFACFACVLQSLRSNVRAASWNDSLVLFEGATTATPSDFTSWLALADVHKKRKDPAQALAAYDKAFDADPSQGRPCAALELLPRDTHPTPQVADCFLDEARAHGKTSFHGVRAPGVHRARSSSEREGERECV